MLPVLTRPALIGGGGNMIRILTLLNAPGSQMKGVSPNYIPYQLPDSSQNFMSCTIVFYYPLQATNLTINYNATGALDVFDIYSLDSTGADIQRLDNASTYNLGICGDHTNEYLSLISSILTIQGNNFWKNNVGKNVQWVLEGGSEDSPNTNQTNRVITASMPICGFRTAYKYGSGVSGSISASQPLIGVIQSMTI